MPLQELPVSNERDDNTLADVTEDDENYIHFQKEVGCKEIPVCSKTRNNLEDMNSEICENDISSGNENDISDPEDNNSKDRRQKHKGKNTSMLKKDSRKRTIKSLSMENKLETKSSTIRVRAHKLQGKVCEIKRTMYKQKFMS